MTMTQIFASPSRFALALGLAVATAGSLASFVSPSDAADAPAARSVRCFFGANSDAKHSVASGWVCAPEQPNSDTQ